MSLDTTHHTDMGALIAKLVAQAPPPPPNFSSVVAATEEEDAREADQPVDDLMPMRGAISNPPAPDARASRG